MRRMPGPGARVKGLNMTVLTPKTSQPLASQEVPPPSRPGSSWTRWAVIAAAMVLQGCASLPDPQGTQALLHDRLFQPVATPPDAQAVFALSPAMRAYADAELAVLAKAQDPRRALITALYDKGQLRLDYDSSLTRNAAQAFEDRAGNCLSLAIMTASFARHLGLPAHVQAVLGDEFYSRTDSGKLYLASGHVNLVLGPPVRATPNRLDDEILTVDFLPEIELRGLRSRALDDATVAAMFLNNRAAEWLAEGQLDQAYAHARAALLQEPSFFNTANTLGVVYNWAGHAQEAEAAFRHVLKHDAHHLSALANLSRLLAVQGRQAEADELGQRLARLQPEPPFHHFSLGRSAMDGGRFREALDHFKRELRLQPFQDEVHFWAAQAYLRLGLPTLAGQHLQRAADFSRSKSAQARYNAKLEHLRQHTRIQ